MLPRTSNHAPRDDRRSRSVLSVLLLFIACATASQSVEPNTYVKEDGTRIVCELEAATGTNRRERVCREVEASDLEGRNEIDGLVRGGGSALPKGAH